MLEALGPTSVPVDEILRQTHLSPAVVSMALLELESRRAIGASPRPPGKLALLSKTL